MNITLSHPQLTNSKVNDEKIEKLNLEMDYAHRTGLDLKRGIIACRVRRILAQPLSSISRTCRSPHLGIHQS